MMVLLSHVGAHIQHPNGASVPLAPNTSGRCIAKICKMLNITCYKYKFPNGASLLTTVFSHTSIVFSTRQETSAIRGTKLQTSFFYFTRKMKMMNIIIIHQLKTLNFMILTMKDIMMMNTSMKNSQKSREKILKKRAC